MIHGLPQPVLERQREGRDRRHEARECGARDDEARGAVHERHVGAHRERCIPPPVVRIATGTSIQTRASPAWFLSAQAEGG